MLTNDNYYQGETGTKPEKNRFTPPPMRGIKQALCEVRAADPNTALTERALRRMVLSGSIPSVRVGTKYLINLDILFAFLSGGTSAPEAENKTGIIRAVAE